MLNLYPNFDPWYAIWHFWPVILIAVGLGKIWDSYYYREHPGQVPPISGVGIGWIIVLLFFIFAAWNGGHWRDRGWNDANHWGWHDRGDWSRSSHQVDLGAAKSVSVNLDMPAGQLNLNAGSTHLLDSDFSYDSFDGKPDVVYSVSGDHGQLNIRQESHRFNWGNHDQNEWNLRMGGDQPIDLDVRLGAGQGNLHLDDLNVTRFNANVGAGELRLYLTGPRKSNFDGNIEGGVGHALIYLPKDIGVRVSATGGIGSIRADGLHTEDGAYVNDSYGKTPNSINLTVHGGIGQIDLVVQ
jgi:N-terminal domain of toast_rack, DUF2154